MSVGGVSSAMAFSAGFGLLSILIYLTLLGVGVYVLVLLIKLMRRGIDALDLYIDEKRNNRRPYI